MAMFFWELHTRTPDIRVHRAGSQLKMDDNWQGFSLLPSLTKQKRVEIDTSISSLMELVMIMLMDNVTWLEDDVTPQWIIVTNEHEPERCGVSLKLILRIYSE